MTNGQQTTFLAAPPRTVPETVALPDDPEQPVAIPLGDGVVLSMPRPAYDRNRERVDWLVRWARKIFVTPGSQP